MNIEKIKIVLMFFSCFNCYIGHLYISHSRNMQFAIGWVIELFINMNWIDGQILIISVKFINLNSLFPKDTKSDRISQLWVLEKNKFIIFKSFLCQNIYLTKKEPGMSDNSIFKKLERFWNKAISTFIILTFSKNYA